jgi:site-specific recombinase XerD
MITLTQAIESHRRHLRAARRAETTLSWYAEQFAAFDGWRQLHALPDVLPDVDVLDEFFAGQNGAGLKPSTVNARFRALRALFYFLEKRRKISHDENPMHLMEAPFVPAEARRFVSVDDLAALLQAAGGSAWLDVRDRLMMHILFYSGLRVGELCALAVADVAQDDQAILVRHGKGGKARLVPCPKQTIDLFVQYLFVRPAHAEALILASDGFAGTTGVLQREGVRQMLIRRCAQARIYPAYSPHAFRHGFAMWMLNAGARLTTVSTAMGHSDPAITHRIYAHTTTTTVRREYDEALARTLNT